MNTKNFFLSLIPWVAFSALATRHGAHGAVAACAVATALSFWFAVKDAKASQSGRIKIIDITGIATFGLMTDIAALGSTSVQNHVIDFGRGGATFVLGAVMLGSVLFVPFTEQYARESVPEQYWDTPQFHTVNRRLTAAWAGVIAVMAVGHLVSGVLAAHALEYDGYLAGRPADLVLNWLLPGLLIALTVRYTHRIAGASRTATR
jgi:hypothetical protein